MDDQCKLPPRGWRCTRAPGHHGPCAAISTDPCYEMNVDSEIRCPLPMRHEGPHLNAGLVQLDLGPTQVSVTDDELRKIYRACLDDNRASYEQAMSKSHDDVICVRKSQVDELRLALTEAAHAAADLNRAIRGIALAVDRLFP